MCGGTPHHIDYSASPQWSIPACAGEPVQNYDKGPGITYRGLSPRVRGNLGLSAVQRLPNFPEGLSPRVRGNRNRQRRNEPSDLSPRVRGNRASITYSSDRQQVYPRVCGGTSTQQSPTSRPGVTQVYPRVCGGTHHCLVRRQSPVYPRVCGGTFLWWDPRSIPACAGEPLSSNLVQPGSIPALRQGRRVYPRVCGGTLRRVRADLSSSEGLSPRVRGNRPDFSKVLESYPRVCGGTPSLPPVYPRVCGGTCAANAVA